MVRCRCGHRFIDIPCAKLTADSAAAAHTCDRKCTKRKSCGKHKCQQKCCVVSLKFDRLFVFICLYLKQFVPYRYTQVQITPDPDKYCYTLICFLHDI